MADMKNFEESLAKLEGIVKTLESDTALDDAIKAFEQGVALSRECLEALKAEKGKLQLLLDDVNKISEEFNLD